MMSKLERFFKLDRFFNSLLNDEDSFDQVLAFEKLCAENDAYGRDVLGKLNRAYAECSRRGSLGAAINREGEFWRDDDGEE